MLLCMEKDERLNLLYQVANSYYIEGKKKAKIAGELEQSATHVANLLKEARERGIVSIEIRVPNERNLEISLKHKFQLQDVVVIPHDNDCGDLLKQLAKVAAEYFEKNVRAGMKIALGGGYLMYEMISCLDEKKRGIHIYPAAIIGRGPTIAHIDPITLVTLLWAKSGREKRHAHYITVNPAESNLREDILDHYQKLSETPKVKELLQDIKAVDTVFLSIGGLEADAEYISVTQYASQNLVEEMGMTKSELLEENAVGDIGYSFFDENGKGKGEWKVGIPLGIEYLREMSRSNDKQVVVVVGSYKMKSLQAVMREKCCNVLITDSKAAKYLIDNF